MTQYDKLNGRFICEIGIAPVRPTEFVIFRLRHLPVSDSNLAKKSRYQWIMPCRGFAPFLLSSKPDTHNCLCLFSSFLGVHLNGHRGLLN
jgi:hypothetical protein